MNKLLLALITATFALGSASGFAADAAKKKEELTTEQKTEIRDRAERMKADRTKAEQTKTTPAKKAEPKRTSKAKPAIGNTPSATAKTNVKKVPAKV
jgi:Ni/Co efflux regulator RcnB